MLYDPFRAMEPRNRPPTLGYEELVKDISIDDIEKVRLVLKGGSVIDWQRLRFKGAREVDQFLRVNEYDPASEEDQRILRYIFQSAVGYLEDNFNYHFPPEILDIEDIRDLFLMASSRHDFQNLACIILKVMHIINHIEGQEARQKLPVTQELLFRAAEDKVSSTVASMIDGGFPILQYQASRKSRDSLITKLLGKPTTIAAQIFDRLRFRIITQSVTDILPVLVYLIRYLFPFNYVVPGESRNDILKLRRVIAESDVWKPLLEKLDYDLQIAEETMPPENPFSASKFKMINVVFDLPLRVESLLEMAGRKKKNVFASVVFQLVEFQIFDKETFERNEQGESSHEAYKNRQKWRVINRLIYGGGRPHAPFYRNHKDKN